MSSARWLGTKRRASVFTLILLAGNVCACHRHETPSEQADRLAVLLEWKPGSVVAEIGAGDGQMTQEVAARVGRQGHVYSTEIDSEKLTQLKALAKAQASRNISVVEAGSVESNLPPECCDSIFMQRVYHHFTEPRRTGASLFRSLRPGGRLAVVDFRPNWYLNVFYPLKGVPKNHGGHGVSPEVLTEELTSVGFRVVTGALDWPNSDYCVVFRKPPG